MKLREITPYMALLGGVALLASCGGRPQDQAHGGGTRPKPADVQQPPVDALAAHADTDDNQLTDVVCKASDEHVYSLVARGPIHDEGAGGGGTHYFINDRTGQLVREPPFCEYTSRKKYAAPGLE